MRMQAPLMAAPCESRRRPMRMVVADDSGDMRDLLATLLHSNGWEVITASDGDAALASILAEGADGLVSDLYMPRVDGLTLCRVLRALRAYARLPIVVFTGASEDDGRLQALHHIVGVRVLAKPTGLREIVPTLSEMTSLGRGQRPRRVSRATTRSVPRVEMVLP